jgi:hypothetical protein
MGCNEREGQKEGCEHGGWRTPDKTPEDNENIFITTDKMVRSDKYRFVFVGRGGYEFFARVIDGEGSIIPASYSASYHHWISALDLLSAIMSQA